MLNEMIKICALLAMILNLSACSDEWEEWWNDGFSPADHFYRKTFSLEYSGAGDFHKDDHAHFDVCVRSFSQPLTNVDLKVTLPHEVTLIRGDLHWNGDIAMWTDQCLGIEVFSKADMKDWSSAIAMHAELIFRGEKIIGDDSMSSDCRRRGCFALWTKDGKSFDPLEIIDKDEWLFEEQQEAKRIRNVRR
jgi:hypothetical protein